MSTATRYTYTYPITAQRIRTVTPAQLVAAVAEHAVSRLEKLAAEVDGSTIDLATLEIGFRPDADNPAGGILAEGSATAARK